MTSDSQFTILHGWVEFCEGLATSITTVELPTGTFDFSLVTRYSIQPFEPLRVLFPNATAGCVNP